MPSLNQSPVALGIAGCGEVTCAKHLPALQHVPQIRVVAVADPVSEKARGAAARFRVPRVLEDAASLVELPEIEVVGVCVPPGRHADVAVMALEAGKHVWIDKPLALTPADCDRIGAAARAQGKQALVGHHMRWHRLVRKVRDLIREGALGEIESVRCVWNSPRVDQGLPEWRWRRASGGGRWRKSASTATISGVFFWIATWRRCGPRAGTELGTTSTRRFWAG